MSEDGSTVGIALSLVHTSERIDIAASDILNIDARADRTFFCTDTQTTHTFQSPHMLVEFAPHIGARIWRLTSQIVDDELAIVVDGEVIARPVVREPFGLQGPMLISANDLDEAVQLAGKVCRGWIKSGSREM